LVYPGRAMGERRVSNIGQERVTNSDLQPQTTREQFIERKQLEARQSGGQQALRYFELKQ